MSIVGSKLVEVHHPSHHQPPRELSIAIMKGSLILYIVLLVTMFLMFCIVSLVEMNRQCLDKPEATEDLERRSLSISTRMFIISGA